jgi:hypothetical protein
LEEWDASAETALQTAGPRFIWLSVKPVGKDYLLDPPCEMSVQIERFRTALVGL